jgi:NitT/TauT family transport system ATP-binding protein
MQFPVSPNTAQHHLVATNISKSFGNLQVLKDVNIEVQPRQVTSLVGPSGCGKTTLLQILAGHIIADTGSVLIDGTPGSVPGPHAVLVTQTDALLPNRTVIDNLLFGRELIFLKSSGWRKFFFSSLLATPPLRRRFLNSILPSDIIRQADAILTQFDLGAFGSAYPRQLSAGMRKRIELLRALLVRPKYLLLDEPFAHLDPLTREPLYTELHSLLETTSVGVLFVTHDWVEAAFVSDQVFVLGGRPANITQSSRSIVSPCHFVSKYHCFT